jgi:MFS transporter, ACS family, D-galactonate transporter
VNGKPSFVSHPENAATRGIIVPNRRRWSIVLLLFFGSMINYLDRGTISMALPLIARDLSLGPADKGLLLSAFFWSYALMQVPMGWCADRYNLRWLYAAAFVLWSLAQGLTGLATSFAVLIGFRILLGIGESIYLPGGTKIVSLLFDHRERGLPCGLFDAGTSAGLVLRGIFIPWLLVRYGWRTAFVLIGFPALLWLIPWLAATPRRLSGPQVDRPWRLPTLNRNLLGMCLGFFCFDYYWYLAATWLPDYLVTVRHLTILRAGLYSSLSPLVYCISEPFGGWIADRLIQLGWDETRARKGMVTIAFLSGLLLVPAVLVDTGDKAILLIMGASLIGLASGNLSAILQSCAPPEEVGQWVGVENFAGNIGGIIAPLAMGLLISRTGSYFPGFALATAVLLIGLLAYWFIVGELKPAVRRST